MLDTVNPLVSFLPRRTSASCRRARLWRRTPTITVPNPLPLQSRILTVLTVLHLALGVWLHRTYATCNPLTHPGTRAGAVLDRALRSYRVNMEIWGLCSLVWSRVFNSFSKRHKHACVPLRSRSPIATVRASFRLLHQPRRHRKCTATQWFRHLWFIRHLTVRRLRLRGPHRGRTSTQGGSSGRLVHLSSRRMTRALPLALHLLCPDSRGLLQFPL
jgi:hypothetical protein